MENVNFLWVFRNLKNFKDIFKIYVIPNPSSTMEEKYPW